MAVYTTTTEQETEALARDFAAELRPGDVLAYRGGLGVGKTAFTRGLGEGLGVTDPVSSPTFSIANAYRGGRLLLVHFDLYRVSDGETLASTGYYDYMKQGDCVYAIEWSENIEEALPEDVIYISLKRVDDNTRRITITGGGDRF